MTNSAPNTSLDLSSLHLQVLAGLVARMASALAAGRIEPALPREALDALITSLSARGIVLLARHHAMTRTLLGRGGPVVRATATRTAREVFETGTPVTTTLRQGRSRSRHAGARRAVCLPIPGAAPGRATGPGCDRALYIEGCAAAILLAPGIESLAQSIGSLAAALLESPLSQPGTSPSPLPALQYRDSPPGSGLQTGTGRLIGRSRGIIELRALIDRFAAADLPVLITGESGTGKELVARALHESGPRARFPFVSENCAAIPETLFESLLFGHVRGAFTGAVRDHSGLLRQAQGGTIFLDEIGEMPLPLQAKMLRVLQEREVRPVGGTDVVPFEARIIAATNRDPVRLVASRRMRSDLFYRLQGITIDLPPLRHRPGDIPMLARHFLALAAGAAGRKGMRIEPGALGELGSHDWPGNVRELSNTIERAVALSECDRISAAMIGGLLRKVRHDGQEHAAPPPAERRMIESALIKFGGRVSGAAREIGWDRQKLYRRMAKLGIGRGFGRPESIVRRGNRPTRPQPADGTGGGQSSSSSTFQ